MTTLLMFAGIWLGALIVYAAILALAAQRFSPARLIVLRAFAIALLSFLLFLVVGWLLNPTGPDLAMIAVIVRIALIVAIGALGGIRVAQFLLKATYVRACGLWLLSTAILCAFAALLVVFVLEPFAFQSRFIPGNEMAPTLVGWHREDFCPLCGGHRILPAGEPTAAELADPNWKTDGICAKCRKITPFKEGAEGLKKLPIEPPDRFLVNKLLKPERWDMVMYRVPQNPAATAVLRLIGLPGETVLLKDNGVWVDGARVEPPLEIAGLEFGPTSAVPRGIQFGTAQRPWKIGPGQCVLLGDFRDRADDSRRWGTAPYGNVVAVVGITCWPPERRAIHR